MVKVTVEVGVKYPPGTLFAAKHNPQLRYRVVGIGSWNNYNTATWDLEGLHINLGRNAQYSLANEDDDTNRVRCYLSEYSLERDYTVVLADGLTGLEPALGGNHESR